MLLYKPQPVVARYALPILRSLMSDRLDSGTSPEPNVRLVSHAMTTRPWLLTATAMDMGGGAYTQMAGCRIGANGCEENRQQTPSGPAERQTDHSSDFCRRGGTSLSRWTASAASFS